MKTYEEYIKIPYKMEIIPDKDEGGYIAIFPELPGCLTCGDTLQEIIENAQDAKCEWIRAAMESGIDIPEPADYGNFKLNISKSRPIDIKLSKFTKKEGISKDTLQAIEAVINFEIDIPKSTDIEIFKLNIPKSLRKSLSKHAKENGISVDQYCLYLLTKSDALYS